MRPASLSPPTTSFGATPKHRSLVIRLPPLAPLAERLQILGKRRKKSQLAFNDHHALEDSSSEQEEIGNNHLKKKRRPAGPGGSAGQSGSGDPADRGPCKRGGRAVRRRLKAVRPQPSQYASDQEGPGDEPLENGFQPAHLHPDVPPEVPSLPPRASHFILALALAGRRIQEGEKSDTSVAVFQVFSSLLGQGAEESGILNLTSEVESNEMEVLQNLAVKCVLAEAATTFLDFVYMVNCIQLRCKVIRYGVNQFSVDLILDLFFQYMFAHEEKTHYHLKGDSSGKIKSHSRPLRAGWREIFSFSRSR